MRIENTQGRVITSFDDWAKLYDTPEKIGHWKEHRSAWSMADFIMKRGGTESINSRVADVLGEPVKFERSIPEKELRFDSYGGRGRVHDLAIYGETESGRSLFVGVEAKVDESFGQDYVRDAYLAAKAGKSLGNLPMLRSESKNY